MKLADIIALVSVIPIFLSIYGFVWVVGNFLPHPKPTNLYFSTLLVIWSIIPVYWDEPDEGLEIDP